jgi:hypothetical protein
LRSALPPSSEFRSFRRSDPGNLSIQDLLDHGVAAPSGLPNPPVACRSLARTILLAPDRLDSTALDAPAAEITYIKDNSNRSRLFAESLMVIPPTTPADATKIGVPAGCHTYRTRYRGKQTTVTVRQLAANQLPAIPGAQVSGMECTPKVAATIPMRIRTYNIRKQGLLAVIIIGDTSSAAAKEHQQVLSAWARAQQKLGSS